MTELQALLARVRAAEGPDYQLECDIEQALSPDQWRFSPTQPVTSSIDSALVLVARLLPGASYELYKTDCNAPGCWAKLYGWKGNTETARGNCNTPSLAILAALLQALLAQPGSTA